LVKVVEYNGQRRITLPKELAEEKGWKPGTKLRFVEMSDGNVMLKKVEAGNARK
jgi:AbrB family looped-hinge helix DNA binding protein